jgi:hypothetical protein
MPSTAAGVATSAAYSASALIGGAVAGFVGGAIASGSLKIAFQSAALGAAFAYIGSQVRTGIQNWREGRGHFWEVNLGSERGLETFREISEDSAIASQSLFVNGQGTQLQQAIQRGIEQLPGSSDFILFHNPTNGLIADTVESALGKLTNTSSISRQLAAFLKRNPQTFANITAHSQGAIILSNALRQLRENVLTANTAINFNGPAVGRGIHTRASNHAGASIGYYHSNFLDAVPNIIGMGTVNPLRIVLSALVSPLLFTRFSPHTVYVP